MLKETELRIGNLVADVGGATAEVLSLTTGKTPLATAIPLTEAILLEFGFEKRIYKGVLFDTSEFVVKRNGLVIIELEKDNDEETFEVEIPQMVDRYLTSVHQLQNLFYCLTGEEIKSLNPLSVGKK